MQEKTASLAKSITWNGSRQTYLIAQLLVDRSLVDDFYRAYSYFRWIDDFVDDQQISDIKRKNFIIRQKRLIDNLFSGETFEGLSPEEEILSVLIENDRSPNSGLKSFICNMFDIIEFDVFRKGRLIHENELKWYSERVGISVTDGLHYFIGGGQTSKSSEYRYDAAAGAHVAHLLRDTFQDIADGYFNLPSEFLTVNQIDPRDIRNPTMISWVKMRVEYARELFKRGKIYLDGCEALRLKIAGYWYCARFESVLDVIEQDGFILRDNYVVHQNLSSILRLFWLSIVTITHHYTQG